MIALLREQPFDELVRQAAAKNNSGDYAGAIKDFTSAIERADRLEPGTGQTILRYHNLVSLHAARGLAYYWSGDYAKAIADFSTSIGPPSNAIDLGPLPDDIPATYMLRGNPGAAVPAPSFLKKLHFWRGRAYLKAGDVEQAITDFDKAIAMDQDFASAWFERGVAHHRLGHGDEADRDRERAIQLKPALRRRPYD
ncbi:MAG: tetratricopeptide repeat protein [Planctomycetes bacterium]|nr:tetratricopeptide repeat protein [Planctomycetota bacterium]